MQLLKNLLLIVFIVSPLAVFANEQQVQSKQVEPQGQAQIELNQISAPEHPIVQSAEHSDKNVVAETSKAQTSRDEVAATTVETTKAETAKAETAKTEATEAPAIATEATKAPAAEAVASKTLAASEVTNDSEVANDLEVVDFVLTGKVEGREPQGVLEAFSKENEKGFAFARLRSNSPSEVTFVWYRNDKPVARCKQSIQAAKKWRTYSSVTLRPGQWKVQLINHEDKVLAEKTFTIE